MNDLNCCDQQMHPQHPRKANFHPFDSGCLKDLTRYDEMSALLTIKPATVRRNTPESEQCGHTVEKLENLTAAFLTQNPLQRQK